MKQKATLLLFILLSCWQSLFGQTTPVLQLTFSKLYATYEFIQNLSDSYPDNEYKELFHASAYYTDAYTDLIKQWDTLHTYESYRFQNYPEGQKIPGNTTAILSKNLIAAKNLDVYKQQSFGIIPNSELFAFTHILEVFLPVYDSLVYLPNKVLFDQKLDELSQYVSSKDLAQYFRAGSGFYNSRWDSAVPFEIAIIPSIKSGSFTATVFLNNAVVEVPVKVKSYHDVFSVLLHEIYHILYDEQSLAFKWQLNSWFREHSSPNSQLAFQLLNEVLATALGNGYVYEQLKGVLDTGEWYNFKYINLMAKQIYPLVLVYLTDGKPMDKTFVDNYIAAYDQNFAAWPHELNHLFTNRYIITDRDEDFIYFRKKYRYHNSYRAENPLTQSALERMSEIPLTKIIVVSTGHQKKLQLIKNQFPELKHWRYKHGKEFVYTTTMTDKSRLFIINAHTSTVEALMEQKFPDGKVE